MTDKRPFTLTITNGNRAQIKAAPVKEAPRADNTNRIADRLNARADVAVAYAGLLGVSSARSDMLETLAPGGATRGERQGGSQRDRDMSGGCRVGGAGAVRQGAWA